MSKKQKIVAIVIGILVVLYVIGSISEDDNNQNIGESTQKTETQDTEMSKTERETELQIKNDKEDEVDKNVFNMTESEFKGNCIEITYNDLDENWIGKHVAKELLFNDSNDNKYVCGATEDFIEEYKEYQHTYRTYHILDKRFDKSFPIQSNDVIKIYGVITDVSMNLANGLNFPEIEVYYIDYIRKWGKPVETDKTVDEIIKEREEEKGKEEEKNKYYDSLNSDYAGETKNLDNMTDLSLDDYILCCDRLNYSNLTNGEDYTGRHISIKVQVYSQHIFKLEDRKKKKFEKIANYRNIYDNFWYCKIYSERSEEYIIPYANFETIYFLNLEQIDPSKLNKGQNLTIYGEVINFDLMDRGDMEILVRYYELD